VRGLVREGLLVEVVPDEAEGEDGGSEEVASGTGGAEDVGDGFVAVFCFVP